MQAPTPLQGLIRDSRRQVALAALGLLGLCLLVYFNQLGGLGLMDKTEGLFVEVPRQMLDSGDWVTPRWNGEPFFDYPVWGYWMVALSFKLFGLREWAARLPSALAATATVLALFAVVLQVAPPAECLSRRLARASLCGAVLALSPGWVGWARSSVTDMFLASAISLALLGYALAHANPERPAIRRLGHGALALFAGVAVLAKGPIGLLLPGLIILVFLVLKGQLWSEVRQTPWLPMLALFFGVILPWYAMATQANGPAFLAHFLGFSNLERFTSVIYSHPGPPWFYLPWVVILLLPWSLYLPVAIARLRFWRLQAWRSNTAADDLPLLALLWLVVMVAFFSAAATKLPGYILPALPGGALLVGLMFQPVQPAVDQAPQQGLRLSGWINAVLLALMGIAAAVAPRFLDSDPSYPEFAEALRSTGLPPLLAVVLVAAAVGLGVCLAQNRLRALWWPNALAFTALFGLVVPLLVPLVDAERQRPIRELAALAGRQAASGEPLLVVGYKRYSVVFYSGRNVLFVVDPREAVGRMSQKPSTVLIFGNDTELLEFGLGPGDGKLLQRRGAHRLLRLPSERLRQLAQQR